MSATLSVVIPHYNHGRYISGCLEALLGQSRPPNEVIVVDDASTDGSLPILEGFERAGRIRLLRHRKNQGCASSLADGFAACHGDYVFMPAADDVVRAGFLEKSLATLAQHPQAGFSCTLASLIDENGRDLGPYRTPIVRDAASYLSPQEFLEEYRRSGNWVVSYSVIFRRQAMLEVGGCPVELGPTVDGYLVHALGARHGACFLPERLTLWRPSENSLASTFNRNASEAIDLNERLANRLDALRPALFPHWYLERQRRLGCDAILEWLTRRNPFPTAEACDIARRLPPGPLTLALRTALASGGGRTATKFYVFLRLPWRDQARIAYGKIVRRQGSTGNP